MTTSYSLATESNNGRLEAAVVEHALLGTAYIHTMITVRYTAFKRASMSLPVRGFFFSCLATLMVLLRTLPAWLSEPWSLPYNKRQQPAFHHATRDKKTS